MPAQLLQRLNRFLDQDIAQRIMDLAGVTRVDHPPPPATNQRRHWPSGNNNEFGTEINNVQSIMIHLTNGWSTYAESIMFENRFSCIFNARGIGPQYFIDSNGTAFTLSGQQDFTGHPRLTWHGEYMNNISVGIENGNAGNSGDVMGLNNQPPNNANRILWRNMTNQAEDLPGMKLYLLLHPAHDPDAVLIWFARFPQFTGSGDIEDGTDPATTRRLPARFAQFRNMLFTERNYRSLALLSRLLTEQLGVPRNFPLLPYLDNTLDGTDRAIFRQLILSDQRRDAIAQKLGTTPEVIQANGQAYGNFYNAANRERIWKRFFGAGEGVGVRDLPCFRGFLSHDINGGHSCPGPLFDWHRFAREIWDWWWYPFDFEPLGTAVSTTRRPYRQARRDTPLIEYYYDANGGAHEYNQLREAPGPLSPAEKFPLPQFAPVYALANGVVVAARFASNNNPAQSGFLLVRHEVFHHRNGSRIDYDRAPTFVWSLIYFLENAGFNIPDPPPALPGATSAANPDWLNRFIMRLRECELAVRHRAANPTYAPLNQGWAHAPSGDGPRLTTGQEIERDANAYRAIANNLLSGRATLFPLENPPGTTPVRVILGDFLGFPNRMSTLASSEGVQIEIFSSDSDRLNVPGATWHSVSARAEDWWRDASAAARTEGNFLADLPADGLVWRYPMTEFLSWINGVTWASEWRKYGVLNPDGTPAPAPPRPISRIVS